MDKFQTPHSNETMLDKTLAIKIAHLNLGCKVSHYYFLSCDFEIQMLDICVNRYI